MSTKYILPLTFMIICGTVSCSSMISKQPEHIEIDHLTPSGHYLSDTLKEILSAAYSKAANLQGIRSFLILKSNKIVAEKYFGSYRLDSLDHVRSVTKSVLSILAGIAYDQGFIKNLDDPIGDYLTIHGLTKPCLLYTSPSPRDRQKSRMPSSA